MSFADQLRERAQNSRAALVPAFIQDLKEAAQKEADKGLRRCTHAIPEGISSEHTNIKGRLEAEGFKNVQFPCMTAVEFRW